MILLHLRALSMTCKDLEHCKQLSLQTLCSRYQRVDPSNQDVDVGKAWDVNVQGN